MAECIPILIREISPLLDKYVLPCSTQSSDLFQLKKLAANDTINFQHPQTHNASLHYAVLSSNPKRRQAVELIVKRGADLCLLNQQKLSALHLSVVKQHSDSTEVTQCFRLSMVYVFLCVCVCVCVCVCYPSNQYVSYEFDSDLPKCSN